jgi:hypothetical protein
MGALQEGPLIFFPLERWNNRDKGFIKGPQVE